MKIKNLILIILLSFNLNLACNLCALPSTMAFERFSVEDGLSQVSIYAVMQDKDGYLWIGTQDGLNRYDGYSFKVYRHAPWDASSLGHSMILCIYEDREGDLWVGTGGGGLNKFIRDTETFIKYTHNPEDASTINSNYVQSIYEDKSGLFWVTAEGKLSRFDRATGVFTPYETNVKGSEKYKSPIRFHEDTKGELWARIHYSLFRYDRPNDTFIRYELPSDKPEKNFVGFINDGSSDGLCVETLLHHYEYDRENEHPGG